ncbi:MAG TPA: amidase [Myxococcales bacterium]|nr:amidase [Myxococcales bacterium]
MISTLAAHFREGTDDPVTALERALAAAERAVPDRSIRCLVPDAMERARASTQRHQQGAALGPLDGIPLVVKDCIDVRGLPTTNGTRVPVPAAERSATVVERLEAAGAIIFAKANMHELGIQPTGVNPHHGTPVNPWDGGRIPGGSSSGAAVSVATGIAAAAIGTDAGGSIRVPAALNGLVGLKPTFDAVPSGGVARLTHDLDHVGPIAWSADDCAALFEVLAGRTLERDVAVGTPALVADLFEGADAEVASAVRAAARECFGEVPEVRAPVTAWASAIEFVIVGEQAFQLASDLLRNHAGLLGHDTRTILRLGGGLPPSDRQRAARARRALTAELERLLEQHGLLLGPTTGTPAPLLHPLAKRLGELDTRTMARLAAQTFPANLSGLPACTVPCVREGLPLGLQIIGRRGDEARVLAAARVVEAKYPPRRPPRYHGGERVKVTHFQKA